MKTYELTPFNGWSLYRIAQIMDISYGTVWRHAHKKRPVSANFAVRYEKALGIPRGKFRPDLWPAPQEVSHVQEANADN